MYRDLRLAALTEDPDAFGSTYAREAERTDTDWEQRLIAGATAPNELALIALVDATPVGLAWGRRDDREPTVGHLFQVWVAPEHRGRGIAQLLTNAVIAWAQRLALRTLRLSVTASHPAASQLYRRAGFVDAGSPEPLRPGSLVLAQAMQLSLSPNIPNRSA
jgi:ribosomal protein S18 acetylase RimI-like enzyme